MEYKHRYGAIPAENGKYKVVKISIYQTFTPTEFRLFDTFEEADQVAKDTANGKYGYHAGQYIYMG